MPLSLRMLKFIVGFSWWAVIAFSAAAMVVGFSILAKPERLWVDYAGFARGFDSSILSASTRDGHAAKVDFDEPIKIKLSLPADQARSAMVAGVAFIAIILALILYFLRQLRCIVRTVEAGDPFVPENARRVRIIGILIFVGGLARSLMEFISSAVADSLFVTAGFDLHARLGFDLPMLISGLSVIALSEVFRHGSKMREEQALTV